MLVSSQAPISS